MSHELSCEAVGQRGREECRGGRRGGTNNQRESKLKREQECVGNLKWAF